jgi:hypothetical protein
LWPWSCFSFATFCGLGHILLLLLFATLIVLNGFSKGVCDQGNGFSERNKVPNGSSIENRLLCFGFGFEIPTTSISLAKLCNHKLSEVMGFVGKKPRFLKT